jgi:phage gpG-like protein
MRTFDIEYSVDGITKLIQKVKGISTGEIAKLIWNDIKENFEMSRDLRGGSLKPLKQSTIKMKQRTGSLAPGKPLYNTGQLYNSIRSKNKGKDESIVYVKANRKGFLTNQMILNFQSGGRHNRIVFGLSDRIHKILQKRLEEIAKNG